MKQVGWAIVAATAFGVVCWVSEFHVSGSLKPKATAQEPAAATPGESSYSSAFDVELKKIGQITPQGFAQKYAGDASYLTKFSWDPTTGKFWDRFSLDPNKKGLKIKLRGAEEKQARDWAKKNGKPIPEDQPIYISAFGSYDFRLNDKELAAFKKNGFVVSERMAAQSCTDIYYRIYKRDLPVFVTTDSILHAWHRSYDAILVEVEKKMLIPALDGILSTMAGEITKAKQEYGNGPEQQNLEDADYFLAVARSLLANQPVKSVLGQNKKVTETIEACHRMALQKFPLFGSYRVVDFSQFKPRGHYEKDEELRRYFRAMMWLGRIDMRVAGDPNQASPRQLAAALVLYDLLQRSGKFDSWQRFDNVIQTFVGKTDSMTFAQLGAVLDACGTTAAKALKSKDALNALQKQIGNGKFGKQEISGHVFVVSPYGNQAYILPQTFTFLGQKFVVDSWATSKVVFDDVIWDDEKVVRRIPSCLDVAFAAFGNDHVVPLLAQRITNAGGRRFRDGLNYQHNLAAVREVLDKKPSSQWSENLYTGWLGCLRQLSEPTIDKKYPEAMRTQAWAMKSTNTQLASWAQLRHDTILYVKQSYTKVPSCYYPAGFVEPVPHFWRQMEKTVQHAAEQIENTAYPDATYQKKHAGFLRTFASKVKTLRIISEKELAQQELSKEETKFLEDVVEAYHVRIGSGAALRYGGWYPSLFYLGGEDSRKWDALVADIHTNPPAPVHGDPGCVLHQGVGSVDLLMIAVDNGKDKMVFAGPTLSHYEFEMPGVSRMTDSEWQKQLRAGAMPPRPEWTQGYLVPGENKEQKNYYAP